MKKILLIAFITTIATNTKAQVCLKTDSTEQIELKLFDVGNNTKDKYVLFKGQSQKVKLKFIKENIKICNECPHTEVYSYYNEFMDDKVTGGTYAIHYSNNKYELTYTRNSDKKAFVFSGSSKPADCTW